MITTAGEDCYCLSSIDGQSITRSAVDGLTGCTHEEADTRLLLHAHHAAHTTTQHRPAIVIKSPDTDVAILSCALASQLPSSEIFFRTGTKQRTRFIPLHSVAAKLGADVCSALVGLHAFTGCDSTSCFVGKGKKAAFSLMSTPRFRSAMAELGKEWQPTDLLHYECEALTCALYGVPGVPINEARYKLFCAKSPQCYQLPPTKDALEKHVQRACYQAAIWRRALMCKPEVPSPHNHGWCLHDGELHIDWMSQLPAPREILELVSCRCKSEQSCSTGRCSCMRNGLPCTDCCGCIDCANPNKSASGKYISALSLTNKCNCVWYFFTDLSRKPLFQEISNSNPY